MKTVSQNSRGFAHLQLLIVVGLVIGVVGFAGGYVYNAQTERREAAKRAENEAKTQDKLQKIAEANLQAQEEKVVVPPPIPEPKPAPPPVSKPTTTTEKKKTTTTTTYFNLSSVSSSVEADDVVLTASLPASYSGFCKANVKTESGENAQLFYVEINSANTCSVKVPKAKLTGATTWKFNMYFKSFDGLTRSHESDYKTFSL